ncbi:hypothetical protein DYU05_06410 [Mucilaginibacter terrenus]|uniref:Bacterial surface antigen (D15) domain-containing protein n=1 Tax=Mucilaginibacter terrenus TaxID=2482727 RepID=A0A3E2NW36_9SPHI|nr:BamA/TamA family outer membrane protein [Mucilaginibacter terrenus]RFZ85228.1 hypothetical protein DYU05_06410 [Mucilaginibacter terrenus]
MKTLLIYILIVLIFCSYAFGQSRDSVKVRVHPSYDNVSKVHRWLFGENYRKEWAEEVNLPVLKLSLLHGGMRPIKEGGGMQSKSLRLVDSSGKEWVLRSVEKSPEKLVPEELRQTFTVDWLDDALSGQHPFSALIVPPIAEAAGVAHANPIIGIIADDPQLGSYRKIFAGTVCLLEEREPLGKSVNTEKMLFNLIQGNSGQLDGIAFIKARMLDILTGDWDRHEDQWRWAEQRNGNLKQYVAVPRDRDQVFHLSQGIFPEVASLPFVNPVLGDFATDGTTAKYLIFKSRFLNMLPDFQISHDNWMKLAHGFVKAETDSVLEASLQRLPSETYLLRHDELLKTLKYRRDHIPQIMDEYYRFIYRIVDLRLTNQDEKININRSGDGGLKVSVLKRQLTEKNNKIWKMDYHPSITTELRIYLQGGNDTVFVHNGNSPIQIRIIGGDGKKIYNHSGSNKINVYDIPQASYQKSRLINFNGSTDSLNTKFVQTNLYNIWMPLATANINADDGFLLGLGFNYRKNDGFRKFPYTSSQQVMLTHSFATDAFRIRYSGDWIKALGKADIMLQASADAPDNTMNYFGYGNSSILNKTGDYHHFYRARFDLYRFEPGLRWHLGKGSTIYTGAAFQFYHFDTKGNQDRIIADPSLVGSYDSLTTGKDKAHIGGVLRLTVDRRSNKLLPDAGFYLDITFLANKGLNSYSAGYTQFRPEFTIYQKLDKKARIVLSDRIGGGLSTGQPAFYQSMFLGGQGNLLGFLQNRFSGRHMLYNNLQARLKLCNIAGYILPGQLGVSGFYDTGRVWPSSGGNNGWHHGTGGGLYFMPAGLTVIQLLAGHSDEGWYPYISFSFRI